VGHVLGGPELVAQLVTKPLVQADLRHHVLQENGAASIANGYVNPMTVRNAIFGFAQAPKSGRHLLDDTVKVCTACALKRACPAAHCCCALSVAGAMRGRWMALI
jgi:hypothetical protein